MKIGIITKCSLTYKRYMGKIEASPENSFSQLTRFTDIGTVIFDRIVLGPDAAFVEDSARMIEYMQWMNIPIMHLN